MKRQKKPAIFLILLAFGFGLLSPVYAKEVPSNTFRLPQVKAETATTEATATEAATTEITAEITSEAPLQVQTEAEREGTQEESETSTTDAPDQDKEPLVEITEPESITPPVTEEPTAESTTETITREEAAEETTFQEAAPSEAEPQEETQAPAANPPELTVTISSDRRPSMELGDLVTLTSKLEGFDGVGEISYQWVCDKGDGRGFIEIPGAIEDHYQFEVDQESLRWQWQLLVYYR